MIEIWKDISTHPNYQISSFGNVMNIYTKKLLNPNLNRLGYLSITLSKNNKQYKFLVHRLVGIYFLDNYENKKTINHKNKIRNDNRVENLEWATVTEQNIHKNLNNDKTIKNTFPMCSMKPIWRIDKNTGEKIEKYDNLTLAQDWCIQHKLTTSINAKGGISQAALGIRNYALGYKWEYEYNNNIIQKEIWKDIPLSITSGHDGLQVSSQGRIKYKNGNIGNGFSSGEYLGISIGGKIFRLHRIIAQVFLENPENKPIVNHKDGNKLNAHLDNLEWVTSSENSIHSYETGLNKNVKPVIQFDIHMNKIKEFKSLKEAEIYTKIQAENIGKVCAGKIKTAKGFRFLFAKDYDENKDYNSHFIKNNKNKTVIQFDLKMNKINEFKSIIEASKELNISSNNISKCCLRGQLTTFGFIFLYKTDYEENPKYTLQYKSKAIKVIQFDINLKQLNIFTSITEAAKELNISDSNIISCCKGKRPTACGFKFMYYDDYIQTHSANAPEV